MTFSMNMSDYTAETDAFGSEYSDEVMYAGWNPDISLLKSQHQFRELAEVRTSLPVHLAMEDAALFLERMYTYQC